MKYNIIGSSSKGNAILIEDVMLLDCGLSYARIREYLKKIKLIFISHKHQDHLNMACIKQIAYNYPTIKFITGSKEVVEKLVKCGARKKNIYLLKEGIRYDLGLVKVRLIYLFHDVDNYGLKWEMGDKKGIYIVDTERIDHIVAQDYDLYLIEANYREEILQKHIEQCEPDDDKLVYLNRVSRTHLSQDEANQFLLDNMGENSVYEYIHQSKYNFEYEEGENEE